MIRTRLAGSAAALIVGLGAIAGTVLTFAAPASASTTAPASASTPAPSASTAPHATWLGGSFKPNPYPEPNAFPSLPTNPWAH